MDYTGPYVRLLEERLRQPNRLAFRTVPPTAAGALEVKCGRMRAGGVHGGMHQCC